MHPTTFADLVLNFAKNLLSLGPSISSIRRLFSVLCFWPRLFRSASPDSADPSIRRERFHSRQNNLPCTRGSTICASVLPPGVEGECVFIRPSSPSITRIHSPRPVRKFTSQYECPTAAISRSSLDKAHDINTEPKCYTVEPDISTIGASSTNNGTLAGHPCLYERSQPHHTSSPIHTSPHNMRLMASPSSSRHSLHIPPANHSNSTEPFSRPISSMSNSSRRSRASYPRYTGTPLPVPHLTEHDTVSGRGGPTGAIIASPARLVAPPNGDRPGTPVFTPSILEVYPLLTTCASDHRYEETHEISPDEQSHQIPALQLKYPEHDEPLPIGWTKPLQPEGACYFMHEERRIFTHADICEPNVLDDVMGFADYLQKDLQRKLSSEWYEGIELVIELRLKEDETVVGLYYFVSPRDQCVFWLQDHDASRFLNGCKGVRLLSHKKLAATAQYWKHWELFPNLCHATEDIIEELRYMMLQARCDHIMSEESTAPLDAETLSKLSAIVDNIRLTKNPNPRVYSAWIVGRIMYEFTCNQFLNFHGQKCARLGVLQSVYGENLEQRSRTMSVLSHVFFGAPIVHVEALHKLYVDGIACIFTWSRFMENLNSELQDFNLLSTVLLNANVGFLAIQSVDNGSGTNDNTRSLTQIASYLSLVASVGSIVLGLVLVRHTRTKKRDSAVMTANFLKHMSHQKYGQETLALIYSLPYALLMWGMLFFLAAFSLECYKPQDDLSRLFVGITSLAIGLLVTWCIYALRAERNGRGTDWWKMLLPRRIQENLEREAASHDTVDRNSLQLSLSLRLRQFVCLRRPVKTQSPQNSDIELAHVDSSPDDHCTVRIRAPTVDGFPPPES